MVYIRFVVVGYESEDMFSWVVEIACRPDLPEVEIACRPHPPISEGSRCRRLSYWDCLDNGRMSYLRRS